MSAPLNSFPRRSPLVAAVGVSIVSLLLGTGCDTAGNQSDRAAQSEIAQSQNLLAEGKDQAEVKRVLESAAGKATEDATRVQAKSLLGQLLMKQARELSWEVDRLDRDAQRLCTEMTELAGQVRLTAQMAEGYRQLNPAPVVQSLQQRSSEARGGADRAIWFEADGLQFPSLSAIDQQISKLEGEIAAKQEEINNLQSQRQSALQSAEDFASKAETTQGRESVEAFERSSNARRQASDLATQIETLNASLEPLKARLELANVQKQYVANAAKLLEQQAGTLREGWDTIQKSAAAQMDLAKRIAAGTGGGVTVPPIEGVPVHAAPAASIAEKAAKLEEIVTSADAMRNQVIELLNEAAKHLGDAAQAAITARSELQRLEGERPNAPTGQPQAWKATRNAFSPGLYQIEQAEALRLLAAAHANHAAMLQARLKAAEAVRSALEASNVPIPPEMQNGALAEKYAASLREASAAYQQADELLETVLTGNIELEADRAAVSAARPQRLYGLYRWSILSADMGDAEAARSHLESARNLIADSVSQNVRLPRLPAELQAMVDEATRQQAPTRTPEAPEAPETPDQPADAQPETPPAGEQPPVEQPAEPAPGGPGR